MASRWAPDGTVQDQIDDTITDEVQRARARLAVGEGQSDCIICGEDISPARRQGLRGVRTCFACQSELDRHPLTGGINRKGSKDSQPK